MARTATATKKTATTATRKPTKKVAAAKRPAAKKTAAPAKRKAKKFPVLSLKPIRTKLSRTDLVARLVEETGVARKDVNNVIAAIGDAMKASIMPKACGEFAIPGVLVVKAKKIPAKKGGQKIVSFGVERISKAKPATVKVRVRSLAKLKRAALGTE